MPKDKNHRRTTTMNVYNINERQDDNALQNAVKNSMQRGID